MKGQAVGFSVCPLVIASDLRYSVKEDTAWGQASKETGQKWGTCLRRTQMPSWPWEPERIYAMVISFGEHRLLGKLEAQWRTSQCWGCIWTPPLVLPCWVLWTAFTPKDPWRGGHGKSEQGKAEDPAEGEMPAEQAWTPEATLSRAGEPACVHPPLC